MIDLYYWPTPNGHKITMFLEETQLPCQIKPVNIGAGDQFAAEFLAFSPNNKMPAMVDRDPADGGDPVTVFESGAILTYLAEKSGKFLPRDVRGRNDVMQWLFWQVGGLGPMAGQNHHFNSYAPEKIPYAVDRYVNETHRLYRVLDQQLQDKVFITGEHYTIADMASYPWIVPHQTQQQDLAEFVHLQRWFETIAARPATQRAYALADNYNNDTQSDAARKHLFGQR